MNIKRALLTSIGFLLGGIVVYYTLGILWGTVLGTVVLMYYVIIMEVGTRTNLFMYIAIMLDIGIESALMYQVGREIPIDDASLYYGLTHYSLSTLLFLAQLLFNKDD